MGVKRELKGNPSLIPSVASLPNCYDSAIAPRGDDTIRMDKAPPLGGDGERLNGRMMLQVNLPLSIKGTNEEMKK